MKESSSSEDSITILYISTLDFNLIIPVTLEQDARTKEKKNLLINDYYFVVLKYKPEEKEIEIFINEFKIQCDSKELFEITDKEELSIKENIIKDPNYKDETEEDYTYVSFSLDILTHVLVDGSRNMGQLLNKIEIYYDKPNKIILYHSKYSSDSYKILSNFCFLKVLNCFESCKKCHINIAGTVENHQCSECKDDYKKFISAKNNEGYYNCYKENIDEVIRILSWTRWNLS